MHKPGQVQPRFTFNYHFVYEDILTYHIEAATNVYILLNILSSNCLFFTNINYEYWVINLHFDDCHYRAFYFPAIWQIHPTYMIQGAKTLSFNFNKLINIVLGPISVSQRRSLLLYWKTTKNSYFLAFYMDNIFSGFKTNQKQYILLCDHYIPYMVWFWLKLILSKDKIGITKIFALGKKYKIGDKVRLKPDKIEKIFTWPIPQD